MTELSKEEMLKEIVQELINKEVFEERLSFWDGYDFTVYSINKIVFECYKIKYNSTTTTASQNKYGKIILSLADLLADPEAMKSLVGEEMIDLGYTVLVTWEGENEEGMKQFGGSRQRATEPAHIYHPMKALKLILEGGDAIDYLWEEIRR